MTASKLVSYKLNIPQGIEKRRKFSFIVTNLHILEFIFAITHLGRFFITLVNLQQKSINLYGNIYGRKTMKIRFPLVYSLKHFDGED